MTKITPCKRKHPYVLVIYFGLRPTPHAISFFNLFTNPTNALQALQLSSPQSFARDPHSTFAINSFLRTLRSAKFAPTSFAWHSAVVFVVVVIIAAPDAIAWSSQGQSHAGSWCENLTLPYRFIFVWKPFGVDVIGVEYLSLKTKRLFL